LPSVTAVLWPFHKSMPERTLQCLSL